MSIRDYDQVLTLWSASPGVVVGRSDSRQDVRRYLRRNPGLSLVARDGDKLVGAVLCGHDGRRGYLHHLAVAEGCRGRGVGRNLVNGCLKRLKRAGIPRCWIFVLTANAEGLKFWRATGWQQPDDLTILRHET